MFITFEGLDGSGKSTQAELLAEAIRETGRDVVTTREPGGTSLGERVRVLLLTGNGIAPWAEAALFTAARAELVEEVVGPALERGAIVICDRYLDSSLAYQGVARGLGIERVLQLNLPAIGDRLPDRTFLLEIDPAESARRVGRNGDRIEREDEQFRRQVADAYRLLAETFPQRIEAVDGSRPAADIAKEIFGRVREAL
jgi:dTMP kinase